VPRNSESASTTGEGARYGCYSWQKFENIADFMFFLRSSSMYTP